MNVFVTGATGFVGSHFCEWLVMQGHQVWGLYRSAERRRQTGEIGTGVHGSLSTKVDSPNDWLDQLPERLDAVVHIAGLTQSFRTADMFDVNTTATRRLVLDLRERFKVLRFAMVSSLAAAGPAVNPPKRESDPCEPVSDYGRSKLEAEHAVAELAPDHWQLAVVRPPIVIGPRDPGMLDLFKMVQGRFVLLPGLFGRWKRYSFVGVADLCEVIGKCLHHPTSDGPLCYFPAHPQSVTFLELMTAIRNVMQVRWALRSPVPMPILWMVARLGKLCYRCGMPKAIALTPDKVREARQRGWVCSSQRSVDELGMEYAEDLVAALARTFDDYQHRNWLS